MGPSHYNSQTRPRASDGLKFFHRDRKNGVELRDLKQLSDPFMRLEDFQLTVVLNELVLRSLHDPAIHDLIKWLDEGWHAYLEQVIRDGIEQSLFRADLDPGSAASFPGHEWPGVL